MQLDIEKRPKLQDQGLEEARQLKNQQLEFGESFFEKSLIGPASSSAL